MRCRLLFIVLLSGSTVYSENDRLSGSVIEGNCLLPVEGATVSLWPNNQIALTDERGRFFFKNYNSNSTLRITSIGHEITSFSLAELAINKNIIRLKQTVIQLSNVTVSACANEQYRPIGKLDIKMRGINNSQVVLRMVPGLFIGQHAGGGKAEQIFLRGFELDHGTDINIAVDGGKGNS